MTDNKPCQICKSASTKKCGRCKNAFYCRREHQEQDWPNHKLVCKQYIGNAEPSQMNNQINQVEKYEPLICN